MVVASREAGMSAGGLSCYLCSSQHCKRRCGWVCPTCWPRKPAQQATLRVQVRWEGWAAMPCSPSSTPALHRLPPTRLQTPLQH